MRSIRNIVVQYRLPLAVVLLWLVVLLVSRQYMATRDLSIQDLVNQLREVLINHWYGVVLYVVAYMIRPVLLFPASLITALAGNVWGLWLGFAIGLLAGTFSSIVPYAGGRWFARDRRLTHESDKKLNRFVGALRQYPFQTVLTMRLLYLPYDTVSALSGGLRIGFVPFFLATTLGNIVGTFAFVGIGASVEGNLVEGPLTLNPVILVISSIALMASLVMTYVLRRKQKPLQDDDERNEIAYQHVLSTD